MNRKTIGWGLLVVGAAVQILEGFGQADATLNNVSFDQTAAGALLAPIDNMLPVSLGYTMIIAGALVLWVAPLVGVK
jgi:hypothetical protein